MAYVCSLGPTICSGPTSQHVALFVASSEFYCRSGNSLSFSPPLRDLIQIRAMLDTLDIEIWHKSYAYFRPAIELCE